MSDMWQSILTLVAAVLIAYAVILLIGMGVWTFRDIRQRTHDGWAQAFAVGMVVLFNIPGLILYLILRPHETLGEAYERRLETEALLREMPEHRTCPRCDRVAREDYLLCPYCTTSLREPCVGCGRALELEWAVCPFCGASGPQAVRSGAAAAPPPVLQQPSAGEQNQQDGASADGSGEPPPAKKSQRRAAGSRTPSPGPTGQR